MKTKTNRPEIQVAPDTGEFAAGAELYRRLERRPRGPRATLLVVLIAMFVALVGALIAFQTMLKPGATPPAGQAQPPASSSPPTHDAP